MELHPILLHHPTDKRDKKRLRFARYQKKKNKQKKQLFTKLTTAELSSTERVFDGEIFLWGITYNEEIWYALLIKIVDYLLVEKYLPRLRWDCVKKGAPGEELASSPRKGGSGG